MISTSKRILAFLLCFSLYNTAAAASNYISAHDLYRNISANQIPGFAGIAYEGRVVKIYISAANPSLEQASLSLRAFSEIKLSKTAANELRHHLGRVINKSRPDMNINFAGSKFVYVKYSYSQLFDWQTSIESMVLGKYGSAVGVNVGDNVVDIYADDETKKCELKVVLGKKKIPEDSYNIHVSKFRLTVTPPPAPIGGPATSAACNALTD